MIWCRFVPIVFIALILLVASACGYGTYTDMVNGFSISPPVGWSELPEEYMEEGVLVCYGAPSPCKGFSSNFNVVQEKLQVPMSVQDFWEVAKLQYTDVEEYTFISKEELTIGGRPAIKHVFTGKHGHILKFAQAVLVEGKTAWCITCTSKENCWSKYETKFDTIINSFQLLD